MYANPLFKTVANKSIFDFCKSDEIKHDIYKSIEFHSLLKIKKNHEKKKFWARFGSISLILYIFLSFIYDIRSGTLFLRSKFIR